jgi:hypothetical protein
MADELFDQVIADAARKREARREARLAHAREWYRKNREAKRARDRAWREAHPDYDRERYLMRRKARAQGEPVAEAADRDVNQRELNRSTST